MGTTILQSVKMKFAGLVDEIQMVAMSQFVIWLDEKVAEYKVQGHMNLDTSIDAPKWIKDYSMSMILSPHLMSMPHEQTRAPPPQRLPVWTDTVTSDRPIFPQPDLSCVKRERTDDFEIHPCGGKKFALNTNPINVPDYEHLKSTRNPSASTSAIPVSLVPSSTSNVPKSVVPRTILSSPTGQTSSHGQPHLGQHCSDYAMKVENERNNNDNMSRLQMTEGTHPLMPGESDASLWQHSPGSDTDTVTGSRHVNLIIPSEQSYSSRLPEPTDQWRKRRAVATGKMRSYRARIRENPQQLAEYRQRAKKAQKRYIERLRERELANIREKYELLKQYEAVHLDVNRVPGTGWDVEPKYEQIDTGYTGYRFDREGGYSHSLGYARVGEAQPPGYASVGDTPGSRGYVRMGDSQSPGYARVGAPPESHLVDNVVGQYLRHEAPP